MKVSKYILYLNYLIVGTVSTFTMNVWTATPKLIGQQQIGDNTVYVYEVSGEDIADPEKTSELYGMTHLPYALCSKALCTIDENDPTKATCVCPIYGLKGDKDWQKSSVGPKNFEDTRPTTKNGRLETVVSNYSMANIKDRDDIPQTTCRSEEPIPWANCFGVRCTVKYENGIPKAVCECPVIRTQEFVSIGPESSDDCQKGADKAWSAATKSQGENNNYIMTTIYNKSENYFTRMWNSIKDWFGY